MSEVLRMEGVTKRFGRAVALDDFGVDVEPGKVTVLLGENGAGKSTILRLALGVVRPTRGTVRVFGAAPGDRALARIGYVPDTPDAPPWMTFDELCRFASAHFDTWNAGLARDIAAALDVPPATRLGQMSRGQGMKSMLVLALAHEPELLLLDEPFGGIDPIVREDVLRVVIDAVRDGERTIVCATHELDIAARIADRVGLVVNGRLGRIGGVDEVLADRADGSVPRALRAALVDARQGEELPC